MKFPFVYQYDQMDCGPACVVMVAKNHGKNYSLQYIPESTPPSELKIHELQMRLLTVQ